MKAREGSRRFSDSKKRLAPGGSLRKNVWRQGEVCEKTSGARGKFAKKRLASKGLKVGSWLVQSHMHEYVQTDGIKLRGDSSIEIDSLSCVQGVYNKVHTDWRAVTMTIRYRHM